MDEDDGWTTSDAEIDSEVEDTDIEQEMGLWLDQLNADQQSNQSNGSNKRATLRPRVSLTPKQVMDSFRCSVLEGGENQDVDLDAILGELCELETQLSSQQMEINTLCNTTTSSTSARPTTTSTSARPTTTTTRTAGTGSPAKTPPKLPPKNKQQLAKMGLTNVGSTAASSHTSENDTSGSMPKAKSAWDDSLDDQLLSALSELSSIANTDFLSEQSEVNMDVQRRSSQSIVQPPPSCLQHQRQSSISSSHSSHSHKSNSVKFKDTEDYIDDGGHFHHHHHHEHEQGHAGQGRANVGQGHSACSSSHGYQQQHYSENSEYSRDQQVSFGGSVSSRNGSVDQSQYHSPHIDVSNNNNLKIQSPVTKPKPPQLPPKPPKLDGAPATPQKQYPPSSQTANLGYTTMCTSEQTPLQLLVHDLTPDNYDADSAFSDCISLPSSGSHVSVTTTSSQNSGSSQHSAASSGSSGSSGFGSSTSSGPAEQASKLKEEKVKIALQKIKDANIKKLFVRVYTTDNSSKSILVDEKMTVAQVCDILVAKNHCQPNLNWSVVEVLPDLYMERMIEDHDYLVENLLLWPRDSNNKLMFAERKEKYTVFVQPEHFLLKSLIDEGRFANASRYTLIQEFFSESNPRVPDIDGMLYLKSEGKKAWKRYYFVLRASGLYYNPKGKGKSPKELVCLQKLDFVEVYTSLGWRKKYKAPTDLGFALKHPQIQKKTSKYIKYLCAEDTKAWTMWLTGIRMAKFGHQLYENFESVKQVIHSWDSEEVVANAGYAEYLHEQEQRDLQYSHFNGHADRTSMGSHSSSSHSMGSHSASTHSMGSHSADSHSMGSHSTSGSLDRKNSEPCTLPAHVVDKMNRDRTGSLSAAAMKQGGHHHRGSIEPDHRRSYSVDMTVQRTSAEVHCEPNGLDSVDSSSTRPGAFPGNMIPVLPVTTQTTKYLSEQNPAPKRTPSVKKTPLSPNRESSRNLPPPPLVMSDQVDPQVHSQGLPPPPSPELLQEMKYASLPRKKRDSADSGHQSFGSGGSLNRHSAGYRSHGSSVPASPVRSSLTGVLRNVPTSPMRESHVSAESSVPQSPRPFSSPTAITPPAHLLQGGHRRTSSGPPSTTATGPGSPSAAAKAKGPPPPPPKRSDKTKLSFHGDSPTPKTANFMADLQRALEQKQSAPVPPPKPSSIGSPDLPPPPQMHTLHEGVADLPPPPAELMEEVRKKKPPPPPPKRRP